MHAAAGRDLVESGQCSCSDPQFLIDASSTCTMQRFLHRQRQRQRLQAASIRIHIYIELRSTCSRRPTRLERELADGVVEVLALDLGDLELERRRPARAVGAGKGARTPGGACVRGRI